MLSSCRDKIDFDYNTISPLCVIEGYLTNELENSVVKSNVTVTVGTTQDMDVDAGTNPIIDAKVMITGDDCTSLSLVHVSNGIYSTDQTFAAKVGATYTTTVIVGDDVYISSSQMKSATPVDSVWFAWEKIVSEDMLTLKFRFQDVPDEETFYLYRVCRNGMPYKWGVFKDLGYKNAMIEKTISCLSKRSIEENDDDDYDKMLAEGDSITFRLSVIDEAAYDYLYSLQMSKSNHANAIGNFTGGALGYFIANATSEKRIRLHLPE